MDDREISNRPEAVLSNTRKEDFDNYPEDMSEDRRLFFAVIGCGVAICCVALPALIVGSIALSQGLGGSTAVAATPISIAPTPLPQTTPLMTPAATPLATPAATPVPAATPAAGGGDSGDGHGGGSTAAPKYSYSGSTGPAFWGDLHEDWAMCKNGQYQSPIDILTSEAKDIVDPTSTITSVKLDHFQDVSASISNAFTNAGFVTFNGHAVVADGPMSFFSHKGIWHKLLQFHFHTPSEHRVDGALADAEVHFVHQTLTGSLLVLGFLIEQAETTDPWAQGLFANLGTGEGNIQFPMNFTQFLANANVNSATGIPFFTYSGSLTTPPCSEGVTWLVFQDRLRFSAADINKLQALEGTNNRPVMPRNGRAISRRLD
mmetsp:Transcript_12905/g.32503  ORF Transcript_12905/g.32503 Transcript_12905/m.32503 type:complete len:375 (+) Transcript_12905:96-1220(+)|eukprot:CAMPEP_0173420580 /NCGR_PEP_ID=MMETSP1357-20121228/2000_1 /TAXON_ID=77926 /ORGANISM="Hemiselmis rufescens, Strain PCC563" /LENGTH=374 /DNA_ID=CAMNT_0014383383 /DNA_START=99 /DNA_END=1223 /DNA_ORIENTATION=+